MEMTSQSTSSGTIIPDEDDNQLLQNNSDEELVSKQSIHGTALSAEKSPIDEYFFALVVVCYTVLPPVFYFVRKLLANNLFSSTLGLLDIYIIEFLAIFLGVGGYQLYFWVQRNSFRNRSPYNMPKIPYIDFVSFSPCWIYFYSLFYYAWCASLVMSFANYEDFVRKVAGGLILLIGLATVFYFFPTSGSHGERPRDHGVWLLDITQKMDKPRNGCPSGHMAFATYVFLCHFPIMGWYGFIAVVITLISCLKLKQHAFIDLVVGTIFSAIIFFSGVKQFVIEG